MRYLNAPNLLSLSRLPLALAFWLTASAPARAAILAAAAASDGIDGWLARRRGGSVPGGPVLDAVTDKIFVLTVLLALLLEQRLAPLDVALLLVRDVGVLIGAAAVLAAGARVRLQARLPGKTATVLQLATLFVAVLYPPAVRPLAWLTGITGALALADYARAGVRSLHRADPTP